MMGHCASSLDSADRLDFSWRSSPCWNRFGAWSGRPASSRMIPILLASCAIWAGPDLGVEEYCFSISFTARPVFPDRVTPGVLVKSPSGITVVRAASASFCASATLSELALVNQIAGDSIVGIGEVRIDGQRIPICAMDSSNRPVLMTIRRRSRRVGVVGDSSMYFLKPARLGFLFKAIRVPRELYAARSWDRSQWPCSARQRPCHSPVAGVAKCQGQRARTSSGYS